MIYFCSFQDFSRSLIPSSKFWIFDLPRSWSFDNRLRWTARTAGTPSFSRRLPTEIQSLVHRARLPPKIPAITDANLATVASASANLFATRLARGAREAKRTHVSTRLEAHATTWPRAHVRRASSVYPARPSREARATKRDSSRGTKKANHRREIAWNRNVTWRNAARHVTSGRIRVPSRGTIRGRISAWELGGRKKGGGKLAATRIHDLYFRL